MYRCCPPRLTSSSALQTFPPFSLNPTLSRLSIHSQYRLYSSENNDASEKSTFNEQQFNELFAIKTEPPPNKFSSIPPTISGEWATPKQAPPGVNTFEARRVAWARPKPLKPDAPVPNFTSIMSRPYDKHTIAARKEDIEQALRAPQLSDELAGPNGIKLWIEGLPITKANDIQKALDLLRSEGDDSPINVRDMEIVHERGMIPTMSAFVRVDFGKTNLQRMFYKLENFGLIIMGMRCPVRTAEVKRTLVVKDVPNLSEDQFVGELLENDVRYTTYDWKTRLLTFTDHQSAYEAKKIFDSESGVKLGGVRTYAVWGSRMGARPVEVRTGRNLMENLMWLNNDLRKYARDVRDNNTGLREPEGFERNSISDISKQLPIVDFVQKFQEANPSSTEECQQFINEMTVEHKKSLRLLKEKRDSYLKEITREVFQKNHRSKTLTAAELGISVQRVNKDTKLKPTKKKRKLVIPKRAAPPESVEGETASEQSEEQAAEPTDEPTDAQTQGEEQPQSEEQPESEGQVMEAEGEGEPVVDAREAEEAEVTVDQEQEEANKKQLE